MKKIISLLLAIVCVFALFSCGGDSTPAQNPEIAAFADIVKVSNPTKIVTNTTYTYGDNDSLKDTYSTEISGSNFVMEFSKQRYATPAAGLNPDEPVETITGTIYYLDGRYSTDLGATWGTEVPDEAAKNAKVNLDSTVIKTFGIMP